MTMHDGEGHVLTSTTAEIRNLFEHALELRRDGVFTDAVSQRARIAAVVPT